MPASEDKHTSGERRLVLVDGANNFYRAFFAIPHLRAPDGSPTNAVYGFINMLLKVVREEEPDYLAVVFDPRGGSFRNRVYDEYKAGRDAQPEDLTSQIPLLRELIDCYHIPILEVPDFEADDVIATLTSRTPDDLRITIVSTDKDLMQLVSERVTLLDGMKDRRFGPPEVEERFGVPPEQILDVRALVGDASDNIPGVKGIGEKGAAKLIAEFGSLERLLEGAEQVKAKRARTALLEQREQAVLSKELATLRSDVPLECGLEDLTRSEPDRARLRDHFKRLGFSRLLDVLDEEEAAAGMAPAEPGRGQLGVEVEVIDEAGLAALASELDALPGIEILAVTGGGSAVDAPVVGLALALGDARAAYLPLAQPPRAAPGELPIADSAGRGGIPIGRAVALLAPLISGRDAKPWSGAGVKQLVSRLAEAGCEPVAATSDAHIAGFLLDPAGAHHVTALAQQHLGVRLETWEEIAGRGAKAVDAADLPTEALSAWAGRQVCAVRALAPIQRQQLERDGLVELFDEVEMPLTGVLSRMERNGVRIDAQRLAALSEEYESELSRIEGEIYQLAGERFLVNSPKQLQVILFEKLGLPVLRKTKTGYSTDEGVLEQLATHHELPERILAWRRLSKLKSTYIDALPPLVNPTTGRIHPEFHQTGAATGRLSAANPNVQNIPIRTAEGVRIREAFVADEGSVLCSADYSQVELRILAHYCGDESLIEAFAAGEDIHRRTAAEVAGIEPADVTDDQRARAKAVNFGIIYGSSAFGLANTLKIATADAQATIDAYFERYKGVRRFLDETVERARDQGYVTTLLGRRRYLPDLRSRNRVLRQAAERMAVNSVIQGTAADLIKKAMVGVDAMLTRTRLGALMILQVHDELVFEVSESSQVELEERVRSEMEGVASMRVPLVVDVGAGATWREAH